MEEIYEELDLMSETLAKSGFFDEDEILEILEEQFMDEEDIDFTKVDITLPKSSNSNFSQLEKAFEELSKKGIISIHNCGYDIEEGVNDAFELLVHLQNNKYSSRGFCFYTFEDIEESIFDSNLKLTFGDFENNKQKALEIGNQIKDTLEAFNFNIDWDGTVDSQIVINPFVWDKQFNPAKEYEMEGAFEEFVKNQQ